MDEEQRSLLIRSFSHYNSSPGVELRYGARGFAGDESVLKSAAYRIGIMSALRSVKSNSVTGVMITACGRSEEKSEVRIVDPDGGALMADWVTLVDSLANAVDSDEFVTLIEESVKKENISFDGGQPAEVFLARDTGPSGEALLKVAKEGISSVAGAIFQDMGILTTPQLHWLVHARNKGMKASERDYFQNLSCSYRCLVDKIHEGSTTDKTGESLVVDGANSVGGDKVEVLKDSCDSLVIEIRNTSKSGARLNQRVGVDFILEQKIVPSGFGPSDIGFRCASLGGDADRLLYFSVLPSQEIEIFDGNKILLLFTLFINQQLAALQEDENEHDMGPYHARLGILQRAMEIGTSANYLKSLGVDVVSFPPGTRSLHAVAKKYDIGIYFEADHHVGVLFSENYVSWLEAKNNEYLSFSEGSRNQVTVSRLLAVSRLMNTTVSDALASLLLVEAILHHNGWSLQKWNEIYCDLAHRHLNEAELAGRTAFSSEDSKKAISHSGTKEVAETFTAEPSSENAKDVSHVYPESKSVDNDPTELAVQQIEDYDTNTVGLNGVGAAVELEQNQDNGSTESALQQTVDYDAHTEEQTNVDAAAKLGQNQDYGRTESSVHPIVDCEAYPHSGFSEDFYSAKMLEEADDSNHVIDKEENETNRNEVDDDAWVIVNDGKGDCLADGSVITDVRDYDHLPELGQPLNEKEICCPKVNGIHAPFQNLEDMIYSTATDEVEEAKGISALESAGDGRTLSPKNNVLHISDMGDYEQFPELNMPTNEKETCSSPKVNGMHAPVETLDNLIVSDDTDTSEEAGVIGGSESACGSQPLSQATSDASLPDTGDHVQLPGSDEPSIEKEGCSSPKLNGVHASLEMETVDDLPVYEDPDRTEEAGIIGGLESACDAQPISQPIGSVHLAKSSEPLNEKVSCSSPKVNGIQYAPAETVDDMIVSDDKDKSEVGIVNGLEYSCDALPKSQTSSAIHLPELEDPSNEKESCPSPKVNGMHASENINDFLMSVETDKSEACDGQPRSQMSSADEVPPVMVQDEQLETKAQHGSVSVDNGEASSVLSDVGKTEERGDLNVVECAYCTITSEVNDIAVILPLVEHAAKVEVITENSPADIDNNNFSSFEVKSVEASVETLKTLPIPIYVDDTKEAGVAAEAENIDVEKGIDGNFTFDEVAELSNPNYLVEVERSLAVGAGTSKHDSEVNGGISEPPLIHVSEPDVDCETTLADVDNKSESTTSQAQVSSHDPEMQMHLESKADKRSGCLIDSSNLYKNMRFGSLDFVANMRLKSEASNTGSRDIDHDHHASSNLEKADANIKIVDAFDETNTQQHLANNQCELKAEDTLLRGSSDFSPEESSMSVTANTKGGINEGVAMNGIVHTVANADEESTSLLEGSASTVADGESVVDEIVRKPFYYLIRIPKYDDEKLTEQIRSAERLLEERTQNRETVNREYHHQKGCCQNLRANKEAAISEEKSARELFRMKRKEIDSVQALVNIAKDAMAIEDVDNRIANMEHAIQHETMSLNEEKKLIREIKQSKQQREHLLAILKKQEVQAALDHKDENEDRVKVLRKEIDALRQKLSEAELVVKNAVKKADSEHAILNEIRRQLELSNDVRQDAYSNLQKLKSQLSDKDKYFWSWKNAHRKANNYAASGDNTTLQSICINQVESVVKAWNMDNAFRSDYIRCNLRSTLRRLGTPDGRSLGPDEEAPQLPAPPTRRINTPVKEIKAAVIEPKKPVEKVVEEHTKPNNIANKPKKTCLVKSEEAQASKTVEVEVDDKEEMKRKEKDELVRNEEELRKKKEVERLKEIRRQEEKVKFEEALERKRRSAEKARAKANLRAKKEAEAKEKAREKRARRKQNKNPQNSDPKLSNRAPEKPITYTKPDKEDSEPSEKPVTLIKRSQKPYPNQNKLKTVLPPPLPLRNRGRRRTHHWAWLAVATVAILALFFLGNLNLPESGGFVRAWFY